MLVPWALAEKWLWHSAQVVYTSYKDGYLIAAPDQSDWTPPVTPALWGRVVEAACEDQQQQKHQEGGYQPAYSQPQGGDQKPWNQQSSQQVQIHHEERKKQWWELDDERKKQLEIGGGLLAGVAALGAGYFAYKEHGKSEEEKKASVWAFQNWLHDAQQRTEAFYRNGPSAPTTWVLVHGKNIPRGAIHGGEEHGQPLYICRAFYDVSSVRTPSLIGKASSHLQKGAVIGYRHEEIHLDTYEILIGDMRALRWVDHSGKLNVGTLSYRPVEGGRESDGTPIYIAQAPHKGGLHPGKATAVLDGAYITYDGTEKKVKEYRVLCYA
ncbi:carbohydrate-binding module family 12 protein [Neolentinus lepideus HHB14362 ss-1]|uniref:Carbohydrate-binding module family 12 protein n=1 Tax=Neolentinus lepideus HHB14362 ss-1 TaxID=1314782 RepID=A0A165V2E4_9AGAM|nr:carbohydrate-binding module family 12 protein [Neolentinus lepideus HHB14362 ss-1]